MHYIMPLVNQENDTLSDEEYQTIIGDIENGREPEQFTIVRKVEGPKKEICLVVVDRK